MLAYLTTCTGYKPEGLPAEHNGTSVPYYRHLQLPFVPPIGMHIDAGDGEHLAVTSVRWSANTPGELMVVLENDRSRRSHGRLTQAGWRLVNGTVNTEQQAPPAARPVPIVTGRRRGRPTNVTGELLKKAVTMLDPPSATVRGVARTLGVNYMTLTRHLHKVGWTRPSGTPAPDGSEELAAPPQPSLAPVSTTVTEAVSRTYLTTEQLAERIHYDARTIRDRLKDVVLLEGIHYIRPFGGRKLLFIQETIERDIAGWSANLASPQASESAAA